MEEFASQNAAWDATLADAAGKAGALLEAMRDRHACELRDLQQRMLARGGTPRHTKKYLDLRHVQSVLAAQKRYAAAAAIKDKADDLMAVETEAWQRDVERDMMRKEELFKVRLQTEADALRSRIAARRGELVRARQLALERAVQRYDNVKKEEEKAAGRETAALEAALLAEALAARAAASTSSGRGSGGGRGAAPLPSRKHR